MVIQLSRRTRGDRRRRLVENAFLTSGLYRLCRCSDAWHHPRAISSTPPSLTAPRYRNNSTDIAGTASKRVIWIAVKRCMADEERRFSIPEAAHLFRMVADYRSNTGRDRFVLRHPKKSCRNTQKTAGRTINNALRTVAISYGSTLARAIR